MVFISAPVTVYSVKVLLFGLAFRAWHLGNNALHAYYTLCLNEKTFYQVMMTMHDGTIDILDVPPQL